MRPLLIVTLTALMAFPVLAASLQTITLKVQNMTCALCPFTVRKALEQLPGVSAVEVDFSEKTARVTYDPEQLDADALTRATTNAGYPATTQK